MNRKMSVSGTFYPSNPTEIKKYFEHFSLLYDEAFELPDRKSRVVIVPHAGYIYSGYSANIAYRVLQNSGLKKFVIIGPSHRVAFEGASLCSFNFYETPLGVLGAFSSMFKELNDKFQLPCITQAHAEHSTEVQFPFLKYYIPDAQIIELIYSREEAKNLSQIIDFILNQDDCGVIISSDLSHFYDLNSAQKLDHICLEAVEGLSPKRLHDGCEACGILGIEALILSAKKRGMHPHLLDYRTSADASGDTQRVVGYMSACFYE